MLSNFAKVSSGEIYRGGEPSVKDLEILAKTYHIKKVISLDAGIGTKIAPILDKMEIKHVIYDINPSITIITDPLNYLIRNISTILTTDQPLYIHCQQGRDRTGFVIAAYRIKHDGWGIIQALNEARKYGYGQGISVATQKLFQDLLSSLVPSGTVDVSDDDDAVFKSRQESEGTFGNFIGILPQHSFGPMIGGDYLGNQMSANTFRPMETPNNNIALRSDAWQDLLNYYGNVSKEKLPDIGLNNNNGPITGAGPIETTTSWTFKS